LGVKSSQEARQLKDWPQRVDAVDAKIKEQANFIRNWDAHVKPPGPEPELNPLRRLTLEEAEEEWHVSQQAASRWQVDQHNLVVPLVGRPQSVSETEALTRDQQASRIPLAKLDGIIAMARKLQDWPLLEQAIEAWSTMA
jgi:hypothetical protein